MNFDLFIRILRKPPLVDVEINWNRTTASVHSVIFVIDSLDNGRWTLIGQVPILRDIWTTLSAIWAPFPLFPPYGKLVGKLSRKKDLPIYKTRIEGEYLQVKI